MSEIMREWETKYSYRRKKYPKNINNNVEMKWEKKLSNHIYTITHMNTMPNSKEGDTNRATKTKKKLI